MAKYDLVVVGTGPGGYVCAIRAAQLGLTVAAVEDDRPGGVCLNWGCIPTKALLRNEARPKSIVVIGAGAVGVEFADVYRSYGVEVTLLEALPRIVPIEDEEVSTQLTRSLSRRGITIKTGVKVSAVKPMGASVVIETDGGRFEAEQVLMAVGRGARTKGIGLETIGVTLERGFVKVSPTMETSVKGVYAIGDMAGAPLLAHKAMAEGVAGAAAIAREKPRPGGFGHVPPGPNPPPPHPSTGPPDAQAHGGRPPRA